MLLLYCLGVTPRKLKIDGVDHPKVLSYIDVLRHGKKVGKKVAIIGQFLESHKFPNFCLSKLNLLYFRRWWNRL